MSEPKLCVDCEHFRKPLPGLTVGFCESPRVVEANAHPLTGENFGAAPARVARIEERMCGQDGRYWMERIRRDDEADYGAWFGFWMAVITAFVFVIAMAQGKL